MRMVNSFVGLCIEKDYISQENAEWLRYALEKRIATVICFVPLLIVGLMIANPATVISFFATFCLLRTRTNGFHGKSICRCLVYSIFAEVLFLGILPSIWNEMLSFISLTVPNLLIWIYAPYNHSSMDLTSEEVSACAKSAKKRLSVLTIVFGILCLQNKYHFALGVLMGIIMTATTLAMACWSQVIMPKNNNVKR